MEPSPHRFPDATLVLVGHGSTLNAGSAMPTFRIADELRRRGVFGQVLCCFWKEEPSIAGVLRGAWHPEVFVVPFFIGEGYFTEEVIPRELGLRAPGAAAFDRCQALDGRRVHYCGPVGTHESMTAVIAERALAVVRQDPGSGPPPEASDISLFVAGHGTGNNDQSRRAIERHVARLRAGGAFHDVHAVFMEEEPRIADCRSLARSPNIVVVPFFISDGLHSQEDIPVLLGESEAAVRERVRAGQPAWRNPVESLGRSLWYANAVGDAPHLPDVVLARVADAAASSPKPRN